MNPVANAFHRAAHTYAEHSQLQQRVGDNLLAMIAEAAAPLQILDMGCGSGEFTSHLCERWPQAQVTGLDQAPAMIEQAGLNLKKFSNAQFFCQDMQQLNADSQYDLITANFALQWTNNLSQLMRVLPQALKSEGHLLMSVPVQGSLFELQQAWSQIDNLMPIRPLFTAQQWLQALTPYFKIQQQVQVSYVEYRPQLRELLRLFKQWGADALPQRRLGLLGKKKWQQLQQAYQIFYCQQGYPLTFEVLMVCAQKIHL